MIRFHDEEDPRQIVKIKSKHPTICESCENSTIVRRGAGWFVYCHYMSQFLRFPVDECSSHITVGTRSLYDMEQVAYVLDLKELKKGRAGFSPPKKK